MAFQKRMPKTKIRELRMIRKQREIADFIRKNSARLKKV